MRSFTTNDLNKQVGEVTDAASKTPVLITRHRKPRFVMMSYGHYQRIQHAN
ncbi:MAG TPA: type II toxin-antitoxin system Phd/YefM family antitoxin, partial [Beijerinckiaceae bacterium]|nr:type II toxin-antitoxin system Phd/YefM family antitoxin [Beijerinckiaceae bacterium]